MKRSVLCCWNTKTVVSKWANASIFAELQGSCQHCVASNQKRPQEESVNLIAQNATSVILYRKQPNVCEESPALLLHVLNFPGSSLNVVIGYSERFAVVSSVASHQCWNITSN